MQNTAQQNAFLAALTGSTSNLALIARAGCGKTTTILSGVEALSRQNARLEILIAAYNTAIKDEIAEKLKVRGYDWRQVQAQTLHGMGFGLLRFAFKPTVNDKKVADIVNNLNDDAAQDYPEQIIKLVRYAKQAGFGFFPDLAIENAQAWHDLADHFDVNGLENTDEAEAVVAAAQHVYRLSLRDTMTIDFDDMILLPLVKNLRVKFGKDVIFLDEAQDLSRTRQALAKKFLKPQGRMVVVGDDRQAIYGFSGADASALENLTRSLSAQILPLTFTFRCPKAVVREAQKIVPDIEAAPTAIEGEVRRITRADFFQNAQALLPTDAILCRNTAPLIETAYKFIRAGIACKVEGREIGFGLIALAKRWKVKTTEALLTRLEDYEERERQKAVAKGDETKAEAVQDKCETLRQIVAAVNAKSLHNVSDVIAFIQDLFADDVKGVLTLATYHRSKGREWTNVYLFEHSTRCPSKAAKQAWQQLQEANLAYVAITRAQLTLTYVE